MDRGQRPPRVAQKQVSNEEDRGQSQHFTALLVAHDNVRSIVNGCSAVEIRNLVPNWFLTLKLNERMRQYFESVRLRRELPPDWSRNCSRLRLLFALKSHIKVPGGEFVGIKKKKSLSLLFLSSNMTVIPVKFKLPIKTIQLGSI